jgi:hypothetical protein
MYQKKVHSVTHWDEPEEFENGQREADDFANWMNAQAALQLETDSRK